MIPQHGAPAILLQLQTVTQDGERPGDALEIDGRRRAERYPFRRADGPFTSYQVADLGAELHQLALTLVLKDAAGRVVPGITPAEGTQVLKYQALVCLDLDLTRLETEWYRHFLRLDLPQPRGSRTGPVFSCCPPDLPSALAATPRGSTRPAPL